MGVAFGEKIAIKREQKRTRSHFVGHLKQREQSSLLRLPSRAK